LATLTNAGFERKTTIEYLDELRNKLLAIRNDWDLSPSSYDGKILQIISEVFGAVDQTMAEIYVAMDPETAVGGALKNHAVANGVVPRLGTFSTANVSLSGVAGTVIPQGTQVKNINTGTVWVTDNAATIPSTAGVTCQLRGAQSANAGELIQIVGSIAGWQGVTNNQPALVGKPAETDAELRVRVRQAVSGHGNNQLASIASEVAKVENLTHLKIIENNENHSVNNVNPHSIMVFYGSADPRQVAEAVMRKKTPGTNCNYDNTAYGNRSQYILQTPARTYQRADGVEVEIGGSDTKIAVFEVQTAAISVRVNIRLTKPRPDNLISDIQDAILQYANATLFAPSSDLGFDRTGFEIGENIHAGKLFTPVNKILAEHGYIDTTTEFGISVGKVGMTHGTQVDIALNEIGVFSSSQIQVVILS
jgi:hypothetical protein